MPTGLPGATFDSKFTRIHLFGTFCLLSLPSFVHPSFIPPSYLLRLLFLRLFSSSCFSPSFPPSFPPSSGCQTFAQCTSVGALHAGRAPSNRRPVAALSHRCSRYPPRPPRTRCPQRCTSLSCARDSAAVCPPQTALRAQARRRQHRQRGAVVNRPPRPALSERRGTPRTENETIGEPERSGY